MEAAPNPGSPEASPKTVWPYAFRSVFEAQFPFVCASLRRLGVPDRDIEDTAHEVFLAVYRRFATYDPTRSVKAWLFGFAYRVASNYRQSARSRREVLDPDALELVAARESTPEDQLSQAQSRRLVRIALETIDLPQRAVFVMHDLDGIAVPAIAQALSIPLNTAYSRLRLARETFAKSVAKGRKEVGR